MTPPRAWRWLCNHPRTFLGLYLLLAFVVLLFLEWAITHP